MRQIYNSAWNVDGSMSYEKAPIARPMVKSLQRLLQSKQSVLQALIMLPFVWLLAIILLEF